MELLNWTRVVRTRTKYEIVVVLLMVGQIFSVCFFLCQGSCYDFDNFVILEYWKGLFYLGF